MANNVNDRCCCLHIKAGMGVIIFLQFLYILLGFVGGVDILMKDKADELERYSIDNILTVFLHGTTHSNSAIPFN
jgi:hypothetical protein